MALTNAFLKSMGIETDQRDQIMAAHQDVLDSIKAERDELRDTAAKVPALEKRAEELEGQLAERSAQAESAEDWKARHDELAREFEEFKDRAERERADAEKAGLYRTALRDAGISERHIDSIMRVTDLASVGVEDGELADAEAVKEAIVRDWGDFIAQTSTHGAKVDTPPSNEGGRPTREEIMEMTDTQARQKAIAENIDLFK